MSPLVVPISVPISATLGIATTVPSLGIAPPIVSLNSSLTSSLTSSIAPPSPTYTTVPVAIPKEPKMPPKDLTYPPVRPNPVGIVPGIVPPPQVHLPLSSSSPPNSTAYTKIVQPLKRGRRPKTGVERDKNGRIKKPSKTKPSHHQEVPVVLELNESDVERDKQGRIVRTCDICQEYKTGHLNSLKAHKASKHGVGGEPESGGAKRRR
ncbi:hypothetical protein TL16_g06199 [Triparma laevis f. inornata]|uniref:Uncharacterized protein n=2 Tax=Triparma laevis TaxID=1534972 RepID=A0A9W7CI29_9STRA|nr:hypothetical protein TL16_g06199 [Triparma laevis f. inornata]GMI05039.1 hypothetical protein TrLO_g2875 [Triparma laevis f. longispina]